MSTTRLFTTLYEEIPAVLLSTSITHTHTTINMYTAPTESVFGANNQLYIT